MSMGSRVLWSVLIHSVSKVSASFNGSGAWVNSLFFPLWGGYSLRYLFWSATMNFFLNLCQSRQTPALASKLPLISGAQGTSRLSRRLRRLLLLAFEFETSSPSLQSESSNPHSWWLKNIDNYCVLWFQNFGSQWFTKINILDGDRCVPWRKVPV